MLKSNKMCINDQIVMHTGFLSTPQIVLSNVIYEKIILLKPFFNMKFLLQGKKLR